MSPLAQTSLSGFISSANIKSSLNVPLSAQVCAAVQSKVSPSFNSSSLIEFAGTVIPVTNVGLVLNTTSPVPVRAE